MMQIRWRSTSIRRSPRKKKERMAWKMNLLIRMTKLMSRSRNRKMTMMTKRVSTSRMRSKSRSSSSMKTNYLMETRTRIRRMTIPRRKTMMET